MDFAQWIKRRLREAKSSGLIRIAKTTPPAKPAAKRTPASSRAPGPSMGNAPRTAPSQTPALVPARYDPNRYTRGADEPSHAPTIAGGTVFKTAARASAPARTPERVTFQTADPPSPELTAQLHEEYSPSVFQPPSAERKVGGRPITVTWASDETSSDENIDARGAGMTTTRRRGPAIEDVKRSEASARSASARALRDPDAPWFGRDGSMAPGGAYLASTARTRTGALATRTGGGGAHPSHPSTVRGVGDKVRRMAHATALAQRDMARRASSDVETPIGGSYSLLLDLQASESERIAKERELATLRRQQRALFAKNKELEETLSAQSSKALDADEAIRRAKLEAVKAQKEMQRAIERQREEDRRVFERRSGRIGSETDRGGVRGSTPVTGVERKFLAGVTDAPATLKEAAARFLGDARKLHEAELRASVDLSMDVASHLSMGGVSPNRKPAAGASFLDRMKERQQRAAARRAEKAFADRVQREALGYVAVRPGWDDSPDVVVRVGGEPTTARPRSAPATARPKTKSYGGGRGSVPPKQMSVAAMRQRQKDERRAKGLEPLADPKPRTPPPGQKRKKVSPQKGPSRRPQSVKKLLDGVGVGSTSPGVQPATGLFAMDPATRLGNSNPKDEIAAMRTILDEVVAHLRLLHVATGGRSGSAAASVRAAAELISALPESPDKAPAAKYSKLIRKGGGRTPPPSAKSPDTKAAGSGGAKNTGVPSRREVTAAMNATRLSGKLVLDSLDHSTALEMLREVENNETAMRAKWGLFSPDHPPPEGAEELALTYAERRSRGLPADASVTVSGELVNLNSSGESGADDDSSIKVYRPGQVEASAERAAQVDADMVARVWEARNQYVAWQAGLDDGVADTSAGGTSEGFVPTEVNEEVAERLLDALLVDVAAELGDACDEATQIVLRHEFSSTANSIDVSSSQRSDDSDVIVGSELSQAPSSGHHSPVGSYDGSTPAVRDRTLGAAMARVGMSPEEASAEIVYEEEDMGVH